MNKKFSTLVASMLLAGGLFTTVDAKNFTEVADNCTGKLYYVQVNAGSSITESSEYLTITGKTTDFWAKKEVADRWAVEVVKEGTAVKGYKLKNQDGKYLEVVATNADGSTTVFNTFEGNATALWFNVNTNKGFDGSLTDATTTAGKVWRYDLQEANAAMTEAQVNAQLGKDAGFKMQIGNLKDNKFVAYSLKGDVFTGVLKASTKAIEGTTAYNALSNGHYYLQNAEGKYLVLTTSTWSDQNTDHTGTNKGWKFTTMTAAELALQAAKDAQSTKKVIKGVEFQISNNEYSEWLEVAVFEGTTGYELLVSEFDGEYVLTVADRQADFAPDYNNATEKTYVKFGGSNLVDMTKFANGQYFYTFVNAEDKVAGALCNGSKSFDGYFQSAKDVQIDMPEGQWSLEYKGGNDIKFVNRENKQAFTIQANGFYTTDKANVYEIAGKLYTINKIAVADAKDGYADFGKTTQKSFNIGVYSPVWNGVAYMTENHSSNKHQIGLDANVENATAWRLEPQAKAETYNKVTGAVETLTDSVYVVSNVSYWGKKDNKDQWLSANDTLKIVSYTIKNAANGEYVGYNTTGNYYGCAEPAIRFAFKQVGDAYNMVEVTAPNNKKNTLAKLQGAKVYGGDSAEKGLLNKVTCMYDRTENDLFKVESANSALYRRLANEIDTISIFRDENASQLLFEDGKFLGLKNENQFEFAPAMLSVAAYAPVDTDRPQYMLAVDATDIAEADTVWCNATSTHKHETLADSLACPHTSITSAYMKARFLVNLKDSAIAFEKAAQAHAVNPYVNTEKFYRLGFVPATYTKDSLIVASSNDSIYVGNENFNQAKFAFKYVDEAAGSFKIETADYKKLDDSKAGEMKETTGWIKWMNGVVVVVDSEKDADIFNMNEEETRKPTANEDVEVSEVSVVAANGAVIVKGAEGKKVAVSNILGQTIANTVVSSDNATIAVPAGIVVVAVEGEDAVKVVVK